MNQTIFSLKTQPSNKRLRVMLGSLRFWLTTLLVIFAVAIMVRLGIWQLDRLEQRRAFNARVQAQLAQPPLILNNETLRHKLFDMEYRTVIVQGEYDFANQVALRNQAYQNRWGVHLLTPLKLSLIHI